ncbi:MAG: diguanylate cyclase [Clostridia bacterium]|jgi:predicted hydrocarbon binding protein|nr:diguanylate cyclase [Clostridia bacterium]MCI1999409.1 diguanylate cyclase [Clostridia bacterium]MCI2015089.1 diguanylate cyclase [Clostridia bacterium]
MSNILDDDKNTKISDYVTANIKDGEKYMEDNMPVVLYRLIQYSIKNTLNNECGNEKADELFRKAGYRAADFICENISDNLCDINNFFNEIQKKFEYFRIGIIKIESWSNEKIVVTVSENQDYSDLPILDKTICVYEEGMVAGILENYTHKKYKVKGIDCSATGVRVCKFEAEPEEKLNNLKEDENKDENKDKNKDILFEFLRDMIYNSNTSIPDEKDIQPENLKLFKGLKKLYFLLNDYKKIAEAMSNGIFPDEKLIEQNPLCSPIKSLEANLKHLVWQTKKVAEGDYSQKVYFMGEFSDSFNMMLKQLNQREIMKKEELKKIKYENQNLHDTNNMLVEISDQMADIILIISTDNKLIYSNFNEINKNNSDKKTFKCLFNKIINSDTHDKQWEVFLETENKYFGISSFKSRKDNQDVYFHIAEDITSKRFKEKNLEEKAYKDDITGIYNRRYLLMKMKDWVSKKIKFTLCFFDLDNLKYINDTYGHVYGDSYIKEVVSIISSSIRENDIFARIGGDEFAILFKNCE